MLKPFFPPPTIQVNCLYSLHYFPFACGYIFPGERHDFWEMVYVDRGEAMIGAGEEIRQLSQGQIIFHQPNEFHSIRASASQGTNLFVISFGSDSPAMQAFCGRVSCLAKEQRGLIARMVQEGLRAFGPVLDVPLKREMKLADDAPTGSAQLVQLLLTQLLLELLNTPRKEAVTHAPVADISPIMENAVRFMRRHLNGNLSFEDICREIGCSPTMLKTGFKRYTGTTVIAYYQQLRVEESRRMLRQGRMSVTRVAADLGYSSPQAFSRQFKRLMGVCPIDYLKMVKE